MGTPDRRGGRTRLITQLYRWHNIPPRALDRRDIETEDAARLVSTANMELSITGRKVA